MHEAQLTQEEDLHLWSFAFMCTLVCHSLADNAASRFPAAWFQTGHSSVVAMAWGLGILDLKCLWLSKALVEYPSVPDHSV